MSSCRRALRRACSVSNRRVDVDVEATRREILEWYAASRAGFMEAIAGLSDAEMTVREIDGWSVKDHVVHVAQWDEMRLFDMARINAGHVTGYSELHREEVRTHNDLIWELRRDWSLEQALWELASTRERLLQQIAQLNSIGLDESRYGELALRTQHESEHAEVIRRWRQSRR